jgi:uncharacterized protein with PQ loop repeat
MLHDYTSLLGPVAAGYGVVGAFSPSLQIVRMRRAGSSEGLSRGYVMIGAGGYLIWFLYGLSLANMPLIVCDAIGAVMQTAVLVWALRLRPHAAADAFAA